MQIFSAARNLSLSALCAGLLAACATQSPAVPVQPASSETVANLLAPYTVSVRALSPSDSGIMSLAAKVARADQVSFSSGWNGYDEDAALKGALTEALMDTGRLGLLLIDAPCDGAAALDTFISGAATDAQAADVVTSAALPEGQKTAALADMLTALRGWNALNADAPIRISGMHCDTAADSARLTVFWGLDALPGTGAEKSMAAAARQPGTPSANHVWLVQTDNAALSDLLPASGWIDARNLPEDAATAAWRNSTATAVPALAPDQDWSADIIFRHASMNRTVPF